MHSLAVAAQKLATLVCSSLPFRGGFELTCVPRRGVSKLISISRRQTHADMAAGKSPTSYKVQLCLESIVVRITTIRNIEERSRVTTLRHKQLGCIIRSGVLSTIRKPSVSIANKQSTIEQNIANLAIDNSPDRQPRNDSILQCQITRRCPGRTEIQVLIPATRLPEVHETVVDNRVGRILDLDCKALCDVVGENYGG